MANVNITDFLGDIVKTMRSQGTIVSITNVPTTNQYVVVVSSLFDLVVDNYINIGGTDYPIIAIDTLAPSLTITAAALPVGTEFTSSFPFFLHATFIAADQELRMTGDSYKKYPIIYLAENYRERKDINPVNQLGSMYECSIFILDTADSPNWITLEHYSNVINKMNDYADVLVNKIKANPFVVYGEFGEIDERQRHAKWGLYVENKGHKTNLFTDNLSGVEIKLGIPLRKLINMCSRYPNWKTKMGIA